MNLLQFFIHATHIHMSYISIYTQIYINIYIQIYKQSEFSVSQKNNFSLKKPKIFFLNPRFGFYVLTEED